MVWRTMRTLDPSLPEARPYLHRKPESTIVRPTQALTPRKRTRKSTAGPLAVSPGTSPASTSPVASPTPDASNITIPSL
jgi:hypothetical protein